MRVVFFGTPAFALRPLQVLSRLFEVVLVVSQPDSRTGRGRRIRPTPVKALAEELGLEVYQPEKLKDRQVATELKRRKADFFFVAAYGKILPGSVLEIPERGCINLHASLLPSYRGAAPIQWAVINREDVTGVTLMLMDEGMDTGPVIAQRKVRIGKEETAGDVEKKIVEAGEQLLVEQLPLYLKGELEPVAQDDTKASYAPIIKKSDALIDWNERCERIVGKVLGLNPSPVAFTFYGLERLKLLRARVTHDVISPLESCQPGTIHVDGTRMFVRCLDGVVEVVEIQAEGRRAMGVASFLRGRSLEGRFSSVVPH